MDKRTITRIDGTEISGFAYPYLNAGSTRPDGWCILHPTAGWVYIPPYRIDNVSEVL